MTVVALVLLLLWTLSLWMLVLGWRRLPGVLLRNVVPLTSGAVLFFVLSLASLLLLQFLFVQ